MWATIALIGCVVACLRCERCPLYEAACRCLPGWFKGPRRHRDAVGALKATSMIRGASQQRSASLAENRIVRR